MRALLQFTGSASATLFALVLVVFLTTSPAHGDSLPVEPAATCRGCTCAKNVTTGNYECHLNGNGGGCAAACTCYENDDGTLYCAIPA